jgi:CheY-like chemotaxis protein
MDDARAATGLIEAFVASRKREANGALLAVQLGSGANASATLESAYRAVRDRLGAVVHTLGGSSIVFIVPVCSAPEARAAAESVRSALAPAPVFAGIANFYEFFPADGTPPEIAQEIERTALRRLEAARRQTGGGVCDATDASTPAVKDRPSVFVIEPDPVSVELLTAALDASGFEVLSFQNGEAAMASLEASPPSLVICEAMTPRLNGFVIRDRLRASRRLASIPFVLVSHRKTEEMIHRAVEADILYFFRKPLSIAEIVGLAVNLARRQTP